LIGLDDVGSLRNGRKFARNVKALRTQLFRRGAVVPDIDRYVVPAPAQSARRLAADNFRATAANELDVDEQYLHNSRPKTVGDTGKRIPVRARLGQMAAKRLCFRDKPVATTGTRETLVTRSHKWTRPRLCIIREGNLMALIYGRHCEIFDDVEIGEGTRLGN
jgi:hypothetical protein